MTWRQKLSVAACLTLIPGVALAYIDPGTGAYAVQVLLALVGTVVFHVTHPIQFLKSLWARFFRKKA